MELRVVRLSRFLAGVAVAGSGEEGGFEDQGSMKELDGHITTHGVEEAKALLRRTRCQVLRGMRRVVVGFLFHQ